MYAQVKTGTLTGLEGELVTVEADLSNGLPGLNIVGLPDRSVKEAKERIRSAFLNSGIRFPPKRMTINLSPADTKKEGTHFDLPIAVGVAATFLKLEKRNLADFAFLGELSLSGGLNPIKGVLPIVMELRRKGIKSIILPEANLPEASLFRDCDFYPAQSLKEVLDYFGKDGSELRRHETEQRRQSRRADRSRKETLDFGDVKGQETAKRGFLIAAAGGHNMLLCGPPGSGKTMMARRMASILPAMSYEELLEVTGIYSASGMLKGFELMEERPFCDPHHTVTAAAMLGGGRGSRILPGQVTLSHRGVLFLDELPEFNRAVLEGLRQPLEEKRVVVSRNGGSSVFPGDFLLLSAMNPCPCGYLGHERKECSCGQGQIAAYRNKLSGPLLDRIDIFTNIRETGAEALAEGNSFAAGLPSGDPPAACVNSASMRKQVMKARTKQKRRFAGSEIHLNSQMTLEDIRRHCSLDGEGRALLRGILKRYTVSGRLYGKIMRLSRSIADLEESGTVEAVHLAEAIQHCLGERLGIFG